MCVCVYVLCCCAEEREEKEAAFAAARAAREKELEDGIAKIEEEERAKLAALDEKSRTVAESSTATVSAIPIPTPSSHSGTPLQQPRMITITSGSDMACLMSASSARWNHSLRQCHLGHPSVVSMIRCLSVSYRTNYTLTHSPVYMYMGE